MDNILSVEYSSEINPHPGKHHSSSGDPDSVMVSPKSVAVNNAYNPAEY